MPWQITTNNKRITITTLTNKAIANSKRFTCAIAHIEVYVSMSSPQTHVSFVRSSYFHRVAVVWLRDPNKWCQRCNFKLQCTIFDLHKMQMGKTQGARAKVYIYQCVMNRTIDGAWRYTVQTADCTILFARIRPFG